MTRILLWTVRGVSMWMISSRVIDVGIRPYSTGGRSRVVRHVSIILATTCSCASGWRRIRIRSFPQVRCSLWIWLQRFQLVSNIIMFISSVLLLSLLVRLVHQDGVRVGRPMLLIGRWRKCSVCTGCNCPILILFFSSGASGYSCTLECALWKDDVSDTPDIVDCTQLVNSRLCKIGG